MSNDNDRKTEIVIKLLNNLWARIVFVHSSRIFYFHVASKKSEVKLRGNLCWSEVDADHFFIGAFTLGVQRSCLEIEPSERERVIKFFESIGVELEKLHVDEHHRVFEQEGKV